MIFINCNCYIKYLRYRTYYIDGSIRLHCWDVVNFNEVKLLSFDIGCIYTEEDICSYMYVLL